MKTSDLISQEHSQLFSKTYDLLVTRLSQDYSQRLRQGRHISESASLSLRTPTPQDSGDVWPTPTASRGGYQKNQSGQIRLQLPIAVQRWSTPTAHDARGTMSINLLEKRLNQKGKGVPLAEQMQRLQYFPTPLASEDSKGSANAKQLSLTSMVANGQLDPDNPNMNGNHPVSREVQRLNPEWVAVLMGTTLEQTFFGCMETEFVHRRQQLHGRTSQA
ncbi:MAG: hypothetical protein AAFY48_14315 [Bacteroidota bacterium]